MRLKALAAFVVFVVLSQLLEGGLSWVIFSKLHLLEAKWQPSSFIVFEGVVFAALVAASLVAARIQRRRLADYGFAAAGAARHLLAGSVWGLGAVGLLV